MTSEEVSLKIEAKKTVGMYGSKSLDLTDDMSDVRGTSFIVEGIETEDGEELETACHPQQILYISCSDTEVKCGDILRVRKENE